MFGSVGEVLRSDHSSSVVQSTPDNSNLQGKSKKGSSYRQFELSAVRVIASSKKIAEIKVKDSF